MCKFLSFYLLGIILAFAIVDEIDSLKWLDSDHHSSGNSIQQRKWPLTVLLEEGFQMCSKKLRAALHKMQERNEIYNTDVRERLGCHSGCALKHTGLFSNNTFDLQNMIPTKADVSDQYTRVFLTTIFYTCVGHSFEIKDECKKAHDFVLCLATLISGKPLDIERTKNSNDEN